MNRSYSLSVRQHIQQMRNQNGMLRMEMETQPTPEASQQLAINAMKIEAGFNSISHPRVKL